MLVSRFFRRFLTFAPLAGALLALTAHPALAGTGSAASDPDSVAASVPVRLLSLVAVPAASWMYQPFGAGVRLRAASSSRQLDYMFEPHLWLMGGVQTVPTGLPLTAETSHADRNSFLQAGVGVGYMLSRSVRAISNWKTGLGRYSVSPGSQFTVGVALRY